MGIQAARAGGNFEPTFCPSKRALYILEEHSSELLGAGLDSGNTVVVVGVKWLKGFLSLFSAIVKSIRLSQIHFRLVLKYIARLNAKAELGQEGKKSESYSKEVPHHFLLFHFAVFEPHVFYLVLSFPHLSIQYSDPL